MGYPVTGLSGSGNKKIPDIPDNPATFQLTGPIQLYTGRITLMKFTFPPLLRHLRSGILLWSFDFSYREKDLKDLRLKRRLKGEKYIFFLEFLCINYNFFRRKIKRCIDRVGKRHKETA